MSSAGSLDLVSACRAAALVHGASRRSGDGWEGAPEHREYLGLYSPAFVLDRARGSGRPREQQVLVFVLASAHVRGCEPRSRPRVLGVVPDLPSPARFTPLSCLLGPRFQ